MSLKPERINLGNNINLNLVKTDKFKSNLLSAYFIRPLDRCEVTMNPLIPLMLKRGTEDYPTNLDLQKKLEEMYGANFNIAVNKRGDRQVVRFSMEWANGDYLKDPEYDYEITKILKNIIYKPALEDGVFNSSYLKQEKENLRKTINGKIDDKRSYAIDKCIEEMCKDEKFSIYHLGYVEDLDEIDEKKLFDHYKDFLETSPIEIFYVGAYDERFVNHLKELFSLDRKKIVEIEKEALTMPIGDIKYIEESLDVNQGKLVMGYRAGIDYKDKLYNGLILASNIFGGGPNSKLFKEVREKESLAYYVSSSVHKFKSIIIVDGGIEFENFQKTKDIIDVELEKLKSGDFTKEDMDIGKSAVKTSMESIGDSIFLISEFFFSQLISEEKRSIEEIIKDFNSVTREEVIQAAEKIKIDTIYFMNGKKAE